MSKTILKNAIIFTSDEEMPYADTVVIKGDKISFVGKTNGIFDDSDHPDTQIYDMNGKMIIPGICDSHIHPGMVSQSAWHIKLPWTEDVTEVLEFVREYAKEHPKEEKPFLYFEYYPTSMFDEKGPTKEMLDSVVSDRPCLLQDFGEHMHWVNSKMLELMEVDKNTADPIPGLVMFVRDENGEPTGWVKEMAWLKFANGMYEKIGWTPPMEMTPEIMTEFFEFLPRHGITAIGDGILEGEAQISSMYELEKQGKLNVYYDGVVRFFTAEELPEKIRELKRFKDKYECKHIKLNTMKLFLDGTNESGNSALLTPHLNDPTKTDYGEILMGEDELKDCFIMCNDEGLDLHIHMVGDRAFRTGCNAVEKAKAEVKTAGEKWVCQPIFAHCELVSPEDMERPAELGITINWSCHWAGGYFGEEGMIYFSKEKWESMYQFNPMIKSGALVAFSSDVVTFYELHRAHPFFGMQVSHTRIDPEFPLDPDKYPCSMRPKADAKLDRDVLLKGYTINSAKQMRWDNLMGSIKKGKLANLCVISDNYFEADPNRIKDIEFDTVVLDGEIVHGKF